MKKTLDFLETIGYTKIVRWLVGQAVKTPPSHGGNRGSIPLRATVKNPDILCECRFQDFYFFDKYPGLLPDILLLEKCLLEKLKFRLIGLIAGLLLNIESFLLS